MLCHKISLHRGLVWRRLTAANECRAVFALSVNAQSKARINFMSHEPLGHDAVVALTSDLRTRIDRVGRGTGEHRDQVWVNVVRGVDVRPTDEALMSLRPRRC